jgi:superfamily II DNA/RNA helicase
MKDAAAGNIKILVVTDQMTRGIDLVNATLVINYDPPKFARFGYPT